MNQCVDCKKTIPNDGRALCNQCFAERQRQARQGITDIDGHENEDSLRDRDFGGI